MFQKIRKILDFHPFQYLQDQIYKVRGPFALSDYHEKNWSFFYNFRRKFNFFGGEKCSFKKSTLRRILSQLRCGLRQF